ncbi:hypothetical protein JHW43_005235 [Diplocarpon mali]|nr:hypothetical protein JHW43_005235 [Diplocarpon mali]
MKLHEGLIRMIWPKKTCCTALRSRRTNGDLMQELNDISISVDISKLLDNLDEPLSNAELGPLDYSLAGVGGAVESQQCLALQCCMALPLSAGAPLESNY